MLNPDFVAELRAEIRRSSELSSFNGRVIRHSLLRTVNSSTIQAFAVGKSYIGQMTAPARVFGEPADPSCMQGIRPCPVAVPAQTLYVLPKARVIGNNFVLGSAGDAYSPSPAVREQDFHELLARNASNHQGFVAESINGEVYAYYAARPQNVDIDVRALFLHNLEPSNYGSFLFRQLPQMLLLRDCPIDFDAYIVPDRTPWLREALQLAGLPSRQIFTIREIAGDSFASIAFLNDFDAEGFFSEDVAARLDGLSRSVWASGSGPAARNIYVSRRLGTLSRPDYRVLSNEKAIETIFRRRGFAIIYPETLSFVEQISAFRQARAIAGPSGSGLLNAMFAGDGAKVLDLESFHYTVRQHAKIYSSTHKIYAFGFGEIDQRDGIPPAHLAPWSLEREMIEAAVDWLSG